jgi:uncharacterized protein YjbI with pentapeptide repeats
VEGVDLYEADLQRADLQRANLEGAKNLTKEQIAEAIINENTQLPDNLMQYREELLESSQKKMLEQ